MIKWKKMESTKKTIIVTASLPMMIRNWIRTNILQELSEKYRVILLTPLGNDSNFVKTYSTTNLIIEAMPTDDTTFSLFGRRLFQHSALLKFLKKNRIDTLFFKNQMIKKSNFLSDFFYSILNLFNSSNFIENMGWKIWNNYWGKNSFYKELFEKYKPVLLFSTHPYLEIEWPVSLHAEKRNIPIFAFIHSWDNPSSRGNLFFKYKKIMVWSDYVKDKILEYFPEYNEKDVVITGAPQYDIFYKKDWLEPREIFLKKYNINPGKKIILFAGGGHMFPNEIDIVKYIIEKMKKDDLKNSLHLWIRFYGGFDFRKNLSKDFNEISYEIAPSEFLGTFRIEKKWKEEDNDFKHLLNLIYHSSLIICSGSTITLDVCVLDKPVINIAFDGDKKYDYMNSCRKVYFGFTHYQRVTKSGAVKIAMSYKELNKYINYYLDNLTNDSISRMNLVKELCGPIDGKVKDRIINCIESELK